MCGLAPALSCALHTLGRRLHRPCSRLSQNHRTSPYAGRRPARSQTANPKSPTPVQEPAHSHKTRTNCRTTEQRVGTRQGKLTAPTAPILPASSAKFIHKKRPGGWKFQLSGRSRFIVLGSFWGQSDRKVTTFSPDKEKGGWNLPFQRTFVVWVWQKRYPAVYLFFYRKPLRLFFDYSCSISAFAINWDVSNSLYQYILLIEHANARVRLRVLFFG